MNAGEFAWKNANFGKGAISAVVHGLKYLMLPLMLVIFGLFMVARVDGAEGFEGLLQEMQTLVLLFGLVFIVLGFLKGAYPQGSCSRLTFGLSVAVLVIAYVFALLLDGRLEAEISREMFEIDLHMLFALYFVIAVFNIFMQLGEFADHRQSWMERSERVAPQEKEGPEQHRWFHDFRLRYGSLYQGIRQSKSTLIGFVIFPVALVMVLKAGFSSGSFEGTDPLIQNLDQILTFMFILGLPMTVLSFFRGFYPRGSISRFLPAAIYVLLSLYWIWVMGLEGRLAIDSIENIRIDLDYSALLLLLMVANSLWIIYYALELWLYRPEWKEGGFQKDLQGKDRKRKGRRKAIDGTMTEGSPPQENSSS